MSPRTSARAGGNRPDANQSGTRNGTGAQSTRTHRQAALLALVAEVVPQLLRRADEEPQHRADALRALARRLGAALEVAA